MTIGPHHISNLIKLFGFHPRVSFAPPSPVGPWRLWPRQGWSGSNGTSGPPASDPSEASVVGPLASCQLLANPCSLHLFFVGHPNSIPSQGELGTCFMSGVWQLPRWTWNARKWQFKPLFLQTPMQPKKTPTKRGQVSKWMSHMDWKTRKRDGKWGLPDWVSLSRGSWHSVNSGTIWRIKNLHPSERSRLDRQIEENKHYTKSSHCFMFMDRSLQKHWKPLEGARSSGDPPWNQNQWNRMIEYFPSSLAQGKNSKSEPIYSISLQLPPQFVPRAPPSASTVSWGLDFWWSTRVKFTTCMNIWDIS